MAFTTLGPRKTADVTLSAGNLVATHSGTSGGGVQAADPQFSGKFYFEGTWNVTGSGGNGFGITCGPASLTDGGTTDVGAKFLAYTSGQVRNEATLFFTASAPAIGTAVCVAVDLDNARIWFRFGSGNWNNSGTADPATNVGGLDISSITGGGIWPVHVSSTASSVLTANFGASGFAQAVPAGFTAGWPTNDNGLQLDVFRNKGSVNAGTSFTIALDTAGDNRVVFLSLISTDKTENFSVSDTAGLAWTLRQDVTIANLNDVGSTGAKFQTFWAHAPLQLTGETITVNTPAAGISVGTVIAFKNANITSPFDDNAAASGSATGTGTALSITGLTSNAAEAIIVANDAIGGTGNSTPAYTLPENFFETVFLSTFLSLGTGGSRTTSGFSNHTVNATRSSSGEWAIAADIIRASDGSIDLAATIQDDAGLSATLTLGPLPDIDLAATIQDDGGLSAALTLGAGPPADIDIAATIQDDGGLSATLTLGQSNVLPVQVCVICV